jgi:hypothetical protein
MIAFGFDSDIPVNYSYKSHTGLNRSRIEAALLSKAARNNSCTCAYSLSSSIGISDLQRQHQSIFIELDYIAFFMRASFFRFLSLPVPLVKQLYPIYPKADWYLGKSL